MNNDRIKGKAKDVAGRIQRQAGEWTGDTEAQVKGGLKQVEGKTQNALGKAKDAVKKPAERAPADESVEEEESEALRRRTG